MTSNQGDLTSRLQRRLETERAEIEATADAKRETSNELYKSVGD